MFVPLEPSFVNGSADNTVQVRCDVACGNYPQGMHFSNLVTSPPRVQQSVVESTLSSVFPDLATVVTPNGNTITQMDAALRRDDSGNLSDIDQSARSSGVEGVAIEPLERTDPAARVATGPHWRRQRSKPNLTEFPQDSVPSDARWKTNSQGPISHTAAPVDLSPTVSEQTLRSPAEKITTFRTYAQSVQATPAPAVASWSQGLVESSRRRAWLWPKIVDELIGRQWTAIHQLGRSALGNSREETRRVLVTSTKRGEGRTTVALALARWAAMTGQRTLLVDADMIQPNVATALHIAPTGDWRKTSLAFGVENNLITCRSLPLSLLPLSPETQIPSTPATLEQLIVQLAVAEQEFDCCIIDAGPIDELCQQMATVTRLSSSIVVVNTHAEGISQPLIGACNLLWQRGKPGMAIADNFRREVV